MTDKWDELRTWASEDLALHADEPNCNCQRCYVNKLVFALLDENEKLREALNELKRAARAWDECPDTMPMDVYARVRGEFDAALGDAP